MKRLKNLICVCLAVIELFVLIGCAKEKEIEEAPAPERDFCRIDGKDLYFLDTETLESLREPLIKLLSNRSEIVYPDEGGYEEVIPDPSMPSISECYSCGLFDVTADGVPELLIHPWGYNGSSGMVDYFVYDIITGEKIEEISTGFGSYCCYFDTERRAVAIVENSGAQGGYYMQYTYLSVRIFDSAKRAYVRDLDISAAYELDEPAENQNSAEYFINNKPASWHDYNNLLDQVYMNYVRIPETELIMIGWGEVSDKEDDRFVSAQKMADALLSSEQKYIIPNEDIAEKDFGEELCLTKSN